MTGVVADAADPAGANASGTDATAEIGVAADAGAATNTSMTATAEAVGVRGT
jgi:hypothetical protein